MIHLNAVKKIQPELFDFTARLIRIPSLTGQEQAAAQAVLEKLQEIGLEETGTDAAGNVLGVLRGSQPGPNILLNGHLDVVPAGRREDWRHEPFGGHIDEQGILHGRGAVDMKGGLAALLFAVQILKQARDSGIPLAGNVIFSAVVYEEAAEMLGMEHLCRVTLPEKDLPFDLCLLAEATNGRVNLGHRGKVELVITTRGRSAHSSTPWLGVNALEKMLPVLKAIFQDIGPDLSSHPILGQSSITVTNLICRPGALSIVPDECEISVDRRYVPGETLESILGDFERILDRFRQADPEFSASIRPRTFLETAYTGYQKEVQKYHPVWIVDPGLQAVGQVQRALGRAGLEAEIGYWKGGTDASMTTGIMGIPTIGYSGADIGLAHTPDEKTPLTVLTQDVTAYVAILCELLGVDLEKLDAAAASAQ